MTKFWENDLDIFLADFNAEASFRQIATIAIGAGGTGYSLSDVLTLATPSGGIAATVEVTHVTAGVVDGISLLTAGAGYSTGIKTTTVSPPGGTGCTINVLTLEASFSVLFYNEYDPVSLFNGQIEGQGPYFIGKDSDLLDVIHGTLIWIDSIRYSVIGQEPTGAGMTLVRLSKD